MVGLNKKDWKFVGIGLLLAFVYINFLLKPISDYFTSAFSRFLILYFFVYMILFFLIRGFHPTLGSFRIALSSFLIGIVADLWLPPYAVDFSGNVMMSGAIAGNGVSDYVFGTIGSSLGISGGFTIFGVYISYLFNFVYVLTPVLIFLLAHWLGARKEDLL